MNSDYLGSGGMAGMWRGGRARNRERWRWLAGQMDRQILGVPVEDRKNQVENLLTTEMNRTRL